MPGLPNRIVDAAFFLYHSTADAERGEDSGGTGFFIGIPAKARPERMHLIAITNWHVAVRGGSSVIRLNTPDGGTEIFEYGPEDWVFVPGSYDVAALPFEGDHDGLDLVCLMPDAFATDEFISGVGIGPGDDVFMPGRFVDLGGAEVNVPVLRFGNIAAMPQPVMQPNGARAPAYCVDMHSRSGYSGSPVFVYRTIGQDLRAPSVISTANTFLMLLGVHWGQFPEYWKVQQKALGQAVRQAENEVSLNADEAHIEGLSGMTCVAPIAAIEELLAHPKIKAWLEAEEAKEEAAALANPQPVAEG